jgi:hypothetical protein
MMMNRLPGMAVRVLAAGLVLAAAGLPAGATTLRRMDFGELVQRADRVVHARAAESRVYRDVSGTQIWTDTIFDVLDDAKGRGPGRLTVSFLGGAEGGIEMRVEGTPAFRMGDEVVLFATEARPDGTRGIVGFSQGVMRVSEDPGTGEKLVTSEVPAGVHFVEDDGSGLEPVRPVRQRARLSTLMDQVRRMASGELPSGPVISRRPEKVQVQPLPPAGQEKKP